MPPRTPKPPSAGAAPPPAGEAELEQRLEQTEAQLGVSREKLDRLASAQAALDGERLNLGAQLTTERTQFTDIASYLKAALAEQTARAEGLERALGEARAALAAGQRAAEAAAAAAEAQRAADEGEKQAALAAQADRLRQADEFLAERDSLRARTAAAEADMEEGRRQCTARLLDMERKHASDRELWRRGTEEAVRAAREEMAALADQRLDATTKQTITDNEAMAGELQYQGRHVQGLLARNTALQKEVAELRVSLGIGQKSEEELVKKELAAEKAVESLMARLEAAEELRAAGEAAVADLASQLAESRHEVHAAELKLESQAHHVADLEAALEARRQELRQLRASHGDAASFLLQALADAKQAVLADQGRAAQGAAVPPSCEASERQLASVGGSIADASSQGSGAEEAGGADLAGLPAQQREALLQRLLERLGVGWQDREGLVLPASGSPSLASLGSPSAASLAGCGPASKRGVPSLCGQPSARATSPASSPSSLLVGGCSSEELMRQLRSDVRPWGGGGGGSGGGEQRKPAPGSALARGGKGAK